MLSHAVSSSAFPPVPMSQHQFGAFGRSMKASRPEADSLAGGPGVSAAEILSGRWTLPILAALREGPIRLGQLHRRLPMASKKVLTETLRRLEESRLLHRRDLSGRIRHVEYHLAPGLRGDVCRVLDELDRWTQACARHRSSAENAGDA